MNVYEIEIENAERGYRLLHHVRAEDDADAIARGLAHWKRPVLSVAFRRHCTLGETLEQKRRDRLPRTDPNDVRILSVVSA